MDSGAAQGGAPNYSGMLAGYHAPPSDPNHHMMELLGLLRAVRHSARLMESHRDIPLGRGSGTGTRERRSMLLSSCRPLLLNAPAALLLCTTADWAAETTRAAAAVLCSVRWP